MNKIWVRRRGAEPTCAFLASAGHPRGELALALQGGCLVVRIGGWCMGGMPRAECLR